MKPDPISAALENAPDPATEDLGAVEDLGELATGGTGEGIVGTEEAGETGAGGETGEAPHRKNEGQDTSELLSSIAALTAQVNALAINQAQSAPEDDPVIEKPEPFDFSSIVTEALFDEVTSDREKFIGLLNQVAAAARDKAIEHTSRSIPIIAASEVSRTMSATENVSRFYRDNKDLLNFKPTVRAIFDDLVAKNPGISPAVIFGSKLAPEVRTRLGLKAPTTAAKKPSKKPHVAPGTGGRLPAGGKASPTAAFEKALKDLGG